MDAPPFLKMIIQQAGAPFKHLAKKADNKE
jgi:hypothetical protein